MIPTRPFRAAAFAVLLLVAAALPSPAAAQISQYDAPGTFQDDFESMELILEAAMADARWRFGPLLVDPWIGVREASYDDNVGNRAREPIVEDFLIKVGAGLRGYLPVGPELVVAGHLLPEYVWWQDLSDRRSLDGRYGLGLFGERGPVRLELSAQRIEETRFFSREFEDRVATTEDALIASLEGDLGRGFALFGRGSFHGYRYDGEEEGVDPRVEVLDRDETLGRFGVRFRPRDSVVLGLGVELSEVDFRSDDRRRSNSGTSPVFELDYVGGLVSFSTELVARSLEADGDAPFPDYDELTGRFRAAWQATGRLQLELLGFRNLVYSIQDAYAYFEDETLAVGAIVSVTSRVGFRVRWEEGSNDFAPFDPARARRIDDFSGWSAELQLELGPATLVVTGSETDYDSNLPAFDRSVTTVSAGLVFGRRNQSPWG